MGARARVTVLPLRLGNDSLLEILFWNKITSEGLPREEDIDNDMLTEEIEKRADLYKKNWRIIP
jgi:hypothetical protein